MVLVGHALAQHGGGVTESVFLPVGIRSLQLNCSSATQPGYRLPISRALTTSNNPEIANMAPFVANELTSALGLEVSDIGQRCQQEAAQPGGVPLNAVLYFCQGSIRFIQPVVQDVWLPYTLGERGQQDDTAVILFGGDVQATIIGARVEGNNASAAFAIRDNAETTFQQSVFNRNLGNPGSAIMAVKPSMLDVVDSQFMDNNSSDFGGAAALLGASAKFASCTFVRNMAAVSGGAIHADNGATLELLDSTLVHNKAGGGGGAVSFYTGCMVGISNTTIAHNSARLSGGGIEVTPASTPQMGSYTTDLQQAKLELLKNTMITNNTALDGGGAAIGADVVFDVAMAKRTIVGNTAVSNDNIAVTPDSLVIAGDPYIFSFVGRPAEADGRLFVQLQVTRGNGLIPCAGQTVEAYWQDISSSGTVQGLPSQQCPLPQNEKDPLPRALVLSLANGTATFSLKFSQPPGNHTILFRVPGTGCPMVTANLTVNVRHCGRGEKQVGTWAQRTGTSTCCRSCTLVEVIHSCRASAFLKILVNTKPVAAANS